eukprot:15440989-Alexandrium_andersonii.AAC.1
MVKLQVFPPIPIDPPCPKCGKCMKAQDLSATSLGFRCTKCGSRAPLLSMFDAFDQTHWLPRLPMRKQLAAL